MAGISANAGTVATVGRGSGAKPSAHLCQAARSIRPSAYADHSRMMNSNGAADPWADGFTLDRAVLCMVLPVLLRGAGLWWATTRTLRPAPVRRSSSGE